MGLIDQKSGVFTTIGSYTSMMQAGNMPNPTNIFASINNAKDAIPYMLDVLKVVAGSFALQVLVGKLFTSFIDGVEPELKTMLKKQTTQFNADTNLPADLGTTPLPTIDPNKEIIDPKSDAGTLINGDGDSFKGKAFYAIQNQTPTNYLNMQLTFVEGTGGSKGDINIKPAVATVGGFMNTFIDNTTIINKKEFMSKTMNSIFGTISKSQGKSVDEIVQDLSIAKMMDQVANDDDSFEISPEDYNAILTKAQEMANGVVTYDMGCGLMGATLPMSGLTSLIANISGSTDPFYIGNQIAGLATSTALNQETANNNSETVKDSFIQKIINYIKQTLILAVTTAPQIRAIMSIMSGLLNNGKALIANLKESFKSFKIFIKCLIKKAMELISKFIFNLVAGFLIALITPVIRKVIKEKINQFVKIMKGLVAGRAGALINTS